MLLQLPKQRSFNSQTDRSAADNKLLHMMSAAERDGYQSIVRETVFGNGSQAGPAIMEKVLHLVSGRPFSRRVKLIGSMYQFKHPRKLRCIDRSNSSQCHFQIQFPQKGFLIAVAAKIIAGNFFSGELMTPCGFSG